MASEDRFKQSVVITLAKRAGWHCSNPECGAITTGPAEEPDHSVNVGEAAHIYGANPGSARYDVGMASADRGAISNAIWLCGNCHKIVDDDPQRYPAGLLFEWQREHEKRTSEKIGKVATDIRQRYERRHLQEFGELSYLAERIVLEKGDFWEYHLAAEVLRCEIAPVSRRWHALKQGLYMQPLERIDKLSFSYWLAMKMDEMQTIVSAFSQLTNVELLKSFGPPGVAGNDVDIIEVSRLFGEVCQSTLRWEESVRFVRVDEVFQEVHQLCFGVAGTIIENANKIPLFLAETLATSPIEGTFTLSLTISLPDGWANEVHLALNRAKASLGILN